MRHKDTTASRRTIAATVTATDAYAAMKDRIPVMKAWEQTEPKRDEELAYTLFDGTRLGRRRNGQIRMARPQDMPLIVPPSWTKVRVYEHVRRAVDVEGMCRLSKDDADAFLKTGTLPGAGRSRHHHDLTMELAHCTDDARRRRNRDRAHYGYGSYGIRTRRDALAHVAERFSVHQTGVLEARIGHHMVGSRRGDMGMHRQVVHVLWRRMVDREIALATLRAYGRKCTVADYNRVAKAWSIPCGHDGSRDRGVSTLRTTHRSAFVLHVALFPGKKPPPVADAIQAVPDRLREITGSAALWRSVSGWSDPKLLPLARLLGRMNGRDAAHLGIDAETGRSLLRHVAERRDWPVAVLTEISWQYTDHLRLLVPFLPALHAASMEARRRRRLRPFMSSFGLVMDMLNGMGEDEYATIARDARNATWARLDERQAEWHRRMVEIRREEDEAEAGAPREWSLDDAWSPLIGRYSDANGEATEIIDVRGLDAEARDLDHCVDDYAPYCISGASRIFSLRTGKHRSTLELRKRYGVWHITQNYGVRNAIPDKTLKLLGTAVAKAANAVARRQQYG